MAEAGESGGTPPPDIDWRMSAILQDVPHGDSDLAVVTSLAGAVTAWLAMDQIYRDEALLTPERPLLIYGVNISAFAGHGIAGLAELLPPGPETANESTGP